MRKNIIISIFFLLFTIPFLFAHAESSNAGFIPGNIWYSKDPFQEGDKIKVYTLVYNSDARQLSGTVFFFDKTTFLGNKNFTVPGKGLQDISIDWTVTAGDHLIFGQIQNAKFLNPGGVYENAKLQEIKTSESKRSVAKTIIEKTATDTNTSAENTSLDIPSFVKENTPEVVSATIGNVTKKVEDFREATATSLDEKKTAVKEELDNLKNKKITSTKKEALKAVANSDVSTIENNALLKPFKYTELFALSLFSTVFNNKYIFYSIAVVAILFILRLIVRRFF